MPFAVVSIVLAATLAGCGSPTAGEPTPTTGDSGSGESSESAEPTTPFKPSFSNTQLCGLLTADESAQLGGSPTGEAGYSTADGHPQCQWSEDTTLVVGFQEQGRAANAKTGPGITNTETTIAGFPAVQSRETQPIEICQVLVDITDEALLGVSVANLSGGEGKYVPCDVANQLANIVIPKALDR
jgi:hypothetical protein